MLEMIKAVIFDLDGVLVDTEIEHEKAFKQVLSEFNITILHQDYKHYFFGKTDNVLFVEHDCPLVNEIPFKDLITALEPGKIDTIRIYHDSKIHPEHSYLMGKHEIINGLPFLQTTQWSQRPHIAIKSIYEHRLNKYFTESCRTMIEDLMYGKFAGRINPNDSPIWIYLPKGNPKRSTTNDGREGEDKFEMKFK